MYCNVCEYLYGSSYSAHQSEAPPVQDNHGKESIFERTKTCIRH